MTDEEIESFKIGASRVVSAPDDGSEDYKEFMRETWRGKKLENKVVFPIQDMIGNIVGLFGRSITTKEFLYYLTIEAKETGVLFGFYQALPTIYETGRVYIVEGPFDLLAFRKVYRNTIATMTAELTEAQYYLLSFYAKQIVTVFDSDPPGKAATIRAIKKWPDVVSVDLGYKDPDRCLKETGAGFFKFVKDKVGRKFFLC